MAAGDMKRTVPPLFGWPTPPGAPGVSDPFFSSCPPQPASTSPAAPLAATAFARKSRRETFDL